MELKMEKTRNQRWIRPELGLLVAITIITVMFANEMPGEFGALSLIPLVFLFWYLEHFTRSEMGFVRGHLRHYGLALLQPAFVLSLVGLAAWIGGAVHLQSINWPAFVLKLVLVIFLTVLLAIVTEEGFFRGWLWASLKRAGQNKFWLIVWTSLAIAAWHLPVVLLDPDFMLPLAQVPVYIINIVVTGVVMALLRLISGSLIVPSISHGVWNGFAYELFGTGAQVGLLGIQDSIIYRPEVGLLGLVLNMVFAIGLWLWYRRSEARSANDALVLRPKLSSQSQDGLNGL